MRATQKGDHAPNRTPQYLIDEARAMVAGGMPRLHVAKRLGIGAATVDRYTRDIGRNVRRPPSTQEITSMIVRWQRG